MKLIILASLLCAANSQGLGQLTSLLNGGGGLGSLTSGGGLSSLLGGGAGNGAQPLSALNSQQGIKSSQCQQTSQRCNGNMNMGDVMSRFAGGNQLIGQLVSTFDKGGSTDFCKKKEDPQQPFSFSQIQSLLSGNFRSALQKQLAAQCKVQFNEDKQRCENTKKMLCSVLPPEGQPLNLAGLTNNPCMLALATDGISKSAATRTGKDACQELSKIAGGEQINAASLINNSAKGLITSGVAGGIANGGGSGLTSGLGGLGNLAGAAKGLGVLSALTGRK